MSSLREVNIFLSFNHPSIMNVKEVVVVDDFDGTFMVMEHMEYDLKGLMEVKKHPFSMSEIKSLVRQLLEGVKYLFHVGFIFLDQPFTYFSLFFSFH